MLKISKLADYAIVLLWQFGNASQGEVLNVNDLAHKTLLPAPTIAKILKLLHHDGLLISKRGAHGGYLLARESRNISLADILRAIDGPIYLTSCTNEEDSCNIEKLCPIADIWGDINHKIENLLSDTSLLELQAKQQNFYIREHSS